MMLGTLALIASLLLRMVGGPSVAEAQQPKKIPRIAILSNNRPGSSLETIDGLRQGLRDLGYIEGENIIIEYRFAERRYDRFPKLAAELVSLHPDVIVTSTTPGVLAVQEATKYIPIVVGSAGDLEERGIVASLAQPGGNITGMTFHSRYARWSKQLAILKEAVPKISHVALLDNPDNDRPGFRRHWDPVSRKLGIQLERFYARSQDEFEAVFSAMTKESVDGLLMANDSILNQNRKRIAALAVRWRLPSVSQRTAFAEAGGLIAYGTSLGDMWRRAASHVDKILKGANPGDIPVERPRKFNLVVNLETAKRLGISMPSSILYRADTLIR